MRHLNHAHVAKELLKPDLSTAESVVKHGLFVKISQIIWQTDIRVRQERHGPAMIASRTDCAVYHMSHHKMQRTPNESHMFLWPVRLHGAAEAQIKNSNHWVEIRAQAVSYVLMQLLEEHSNVIRPQSTLPGAGLTYRGLIGPQQGRMLSFHACLRKGGGTTSVIQLLPSFCHVPMGATQGPIQMYQ